MKKQHQKTAFFYINALENALLFATNTNADEAQQIKDEATADGYDANALYMVARKRALFLVNNY